MKNTPKTPMYPIFDQPIPEEDYEAPRWSHFTEIRCKQEYKDYWESLCWSPNHFNGTVGVIIRGNVYVIKGMAFGVYPKDYTAPLSNT